MKKKSGITVMILVISIVVTIIFVSAVMITSFKEDGIFDVTKRSVKANNDAILSERIAKLNLESMKTKAPFTEKTIKILKAAVRQSPADLDKLGVYINTYNSEIQLVVYRWDKVTKKDIEWFLDNTVTIEIDGKEINCKIFPLPGDINFDIDINEEDVKVCREINAGIVNIDRETAIVFFDINYDGVINSTDVTQIRVLSSGLISVNENNTIFKAESEEMGVSNFDYSEFGNRIAKYIGRTNSN